mmetsp:Transcript_15282/g.49897  ORF Transcript_15282/g.49897 Transcript_15282/m.49897 type:complete len:253 (-) Transcript_15282:117-875(-)
MDCGLSLPSPSQHTRPTNVDGSGPVLSRPATGGVSGGVGGGAGPVAGGAALGSASASSAGTASAFVPCASMSSASKDATTSSILRALSSSLSHMNDAPGGLPSSSRTPTAGMELAWPSSGCSVPTTLPASVRLPKPPGGEWSPPSPPMLSGGIGLEKDGRALRLIGVSPSTERSRCAESLLKVDRACGRTMACVRASATAARESAVFCRFVAVCLSVSSNSASWSNVIGCDALFEFICITSHLVPRSPAERP